ncbi:MAG: autotransporter domain-containing protein [Rhodothermaceae bacterium]|nr:autotransporter domain-containing protein [Rhodothermaceae bacterium]
MATGSGYSIGSPSSHTLTIVDDDVLPEAAFASDPTIVDEDDAGPHNITVNLSPVPTTTVTLNYTLSGSATGGGADYSIPGSGTTRTVTVAANKASANIPVTINNDADIEGAEEIILTLATGSGYSIGSPSSHTLTIRDNDVPPETPKIRFGMDISRAEESDGIVKVPMTIDPAPTSAFTVSYTYRGSATYGTDYTTSGTFSTVAGATEAIIEITVVNDYIAETSETLILTLESDPESDYVLGAPKVHTLTIDDDDKVGIIFMPDPLDIREGEERMYSVALSSQPTAQVMVKISSDNPILTVPQVPLVFNVTDWNTPIDVVVRAGPDDNDRNETVRLIHTAEGGDYNMEIGYLQVNVIDDDEARLMVRPSRITIPEGNSTSFDVEISVPPVQEVIVEITGFAGTDLSLAKRTLTFGPSDWKESKTVTVTAESDDDADDDRETLTLKASGSGYDDVFANVDVTIEDDDRHGLTVDNSRIVLREGGPPDTYTITLLSEPTSSVMVAITGHEGTAVTLDKTELTFTPSGTKAWNRPQTVTVMAGADDDTKDNTVTLWHAQTSADPNYNGRTGPSVEVVVIDKGEDVLTVSIIDQIDTQEDIGLVSLSVELNRPAPMPISVNYETVERTAEGDADYVTSKGIIVFTTGSKRGVLQIGIVNDDDPEQSEQFEVRLSNAVEGLTIAQGVAMVTILDDDQRASAWIADEVVFEDAGKVQFTVHLSQPIRHPLSVHYRTEDGTAKAGTDYLAAQGILTFYPGSAEEVIEVALIRGELEWQAKTFSVRLESSDEIRLDKAVAIAIIQESESVQEEVLASYSIRFVRTVSSQIVEALSELVRRRANEVVCSAGERTEMAQLWHSNSSWAPSMGELFSGCRTSTQFSGFGVWGRGMYRRFNGSEGTLSLDGEVSTGMFGIDYRVSGRWLAGMLVSRSQGDGSFEVREKSGQIQAALTGLYPYASYRRGDLEVWLSGGYGQGESETQELAETLTSRFGMLGVQGRLASLDRLHLRYHGDVLAADAKVLEEGLEVVRLRLGIEGDLRISDHIRPYVELNARQDAGSAETGTGLEVGGGVRVVIPAWHLRGDVRTQGLIMHTENEFTEWGISGSLQVGGGSEGFMLSVRPSWGPNQSGALHHQQTLLESVPVKGSLHRTEFEMGYGMPLDMGVARSMFGVTVLPGVILFRLGEELQTKEMFRVSISGIARTSIPAELGLNLQGTLRY